MVTAELETIKNLTGVEESHICFRDDGFMSRGYIIDGGRLVFKFKKRPDTTYVYEMQNLHYLNQQNLGVHLQRVAFTADDDSYLGLYGVPGLSLEQYTMDDVSYRTIGQQLGEFLRKLHALKPKMTTVYPLSELIRAWQARYAKAKKTLIKYLDAEEMVYIDRLMTREMPDILQKRGENRVFSHADLGDGNVLIDNQGTVGIIDFNESGYIDEAADFMDITDDNLCSVMLDSYGADENLRKKVAIQRRIRPIFVLDVYADRGEDTIQPIVRQIKNHLNSKNSL